MCKVSRDMEIEDICLSCPRVVICWTDRSAGMVSRMMAACKNDATTRRVIACLGAGAIKINMRT